MAPRRRPRSVPGLGPLLWLSVAGPLAAPAAATAQDVIVTTSAGEPTLDDRTLQHFVREGLREQGVVVLRRMSDLEEGRVCLEYVLSVLEVERKRYDAAVASSVVVKRSNGVLDRTRPRILHQFHDFEELKEMADLIVEGIVSELAAIEESG